MEPHLIPLILELEVCPITGQPDNTAEFVKLSKELEKFTPLNTEIRWKINEIMRLHKEKHNCVYIVGLTNYYPGIQPIHAKRSGKIVSLSIKDLEEFFNITYTPDMNFVYVHTDTFDDIINKYF